MKFPEHMAHSMPLTIYSIPSIHSIHSRVSPHPVLCAMCSASRPSHTAMCFCISAAHGSQRAKVLLRTHPYLSVHIRTPPPPPCALRNAHCQPPLPHSHVFLHIRSAWLTESQSPTPYSSVPVRTSPFYTAHTLCSAPCAPPANNTKKSADTFRYLRLISEEISYSSSGYFSVRGAMRRLFLGQASTHAAQRMQRKRSNCQD